MVTEDYTFSSVYTFISSPLLMPFTCIPRTFYYVEMWFSSEITVSKQPLYLVVTMTPMLSETFLLMKA